MGVLMNTVESGDYKGGDIKLKGFSNKPTLVVKSLFGKNEIRLDKSTVADYSIISTQESVGSTVFRSKVQFKNGKSSTVLINDLVHNAIMKALG